MKKLLASLSSFAVALAVFVPLSASSGCSWFEHTVEPAAGSTATCIGEDVTQIVKEDGVSILVDIASAVLSGGSTLPALFDQLEADFTDANLIACAAIFVDIVDGALPIPVAPTAGAGSDTASASSATSALLLQQGLAVLRSEIAKRWPAFAPTLTKAAATKRSK
jgi:dihydroxyacetone kinase DhaKLM complex PTS-EIIA-like component DhaM